MRFRGDNGPGRADYIERWDCRSRRTHNVGFIIALGSSWASRWVSAEVELGSFVTRDAQSFPSVSFGAEKFSRPIFLSIICGLWFLIVGDWFQSLASSLYFRIIAWQGCGCVEISFEN